MAQYQKVSERKRADIHPACGNKLNEKQIPEDLLNKAKHIAATYGHKKLTNFYCFDEYGINLLDDSEKIACCLKENHMSLKGLSREYVLRTFGDNVANRIYPQYEYEVDTYYLAAFYILTSSQDLRSKFIKHIGNDGIDFLKMKKVDMGSGLNTLVKLANNLFNGDSKVSPSDLLNTLDEDNFEVSIHAIRLRRIKIYLNDLI
jgi:hypothetical protein